MRPRPSSLLTIILAPFILSGCDGCVVLRTEHKFETEHKSEDLTKFGKNLEGAASRAGEHAFENTLNVKNLYDTIEKKNAEINDLRERIRILTLKLNPKDQPHPGIVGGYKCRTNQLPCRVEWLGGNLYRFYNEYPPQFQDATFDPNTQLFTGEGFSWGPAFFFAKTSKLVFASETIWYR